MNLFLDCRGGVNLDERAAPRVETPRSRLDRLGAPLAWSGARFGIR